MKLQDEFKLKTRQAGATTWMLNHLIDSVKKGEPVSIVVGANSVQCFWLFHAICTRLEKEQIIFKSDQYWMTIRVFQENESVLRVMNTDYFLMRLQGNDPTGIYIDHAAIDLGTLNKKDIDFINKTLNIEE